MGDAGEVMSRRYSADDPYRRLDIADVTSRRMADELAVLEHHKGTRYSMKATSPDYDDKDHVGAGIAIGGGTGLLLGMIAGPLRLIF